MPCTAPPWVLRFSKLRIDQSVLCLLLHELRRSYKESYRASIAKYGNLPRRRKQTESDLVVAWLVYSQAKGLVSRTYQTLSPIYWLGLPLPSYAGIMASHGERARLDSFLAKCRDAILVSCPKKRAWSRNSSG